MKRIILYIYLILVHSTLFGQQTVEVDANFGREIQFYASSGNYAAATQVTTNLSQHMQTYLFYDDFRMFTFYQWEIGDTIVPTGSTINTVELQFTYWSTDGAIQVFQGFVDITGEEVGLYEDYDEIYENLIASDNQGDTVVVHISNEKLKNAFSASRDTTFFAIAILKSSGRDENGWCFEPSLTINFTPPQQDVTVKQKLSTGIEFGNYSLWENNNWNSYASGTVRPFDIALPEYPRAQTSLYSGEKFYVWDDQRSYLNFDEIEVDELTNEIIGHFSGVNYVTIRNQLLHTNEHDGAVEFADPWYYDEIVADKGLRNRGFDAIFNELNSPYVVTPMSAHKGVFLNQNPQFYPSLPIYSVKSVSPQEVEINGTDFNFYFQKWSTTTSADATFADVNNSETDVVFHNQGAVVQAEMKGTSITDNATDFNKGTQRKMFRNAYTTNRIYESDNSIWYEKYDNSIDNWIIPGNGIKLNTLTPATNPSILKMGTDAALVAFLERDDLKVFGLFGNTRAQILTHDLENYTTYPVIEYAGNTFSTGTFEGYILAWAAKGDNEKGIYCIFGEYNGAKSTIVYHITGTDENDHSPHVSTIVKNGKIFYNVAWVKEDVNSEASQIYFKEFIQTSNTLGSIITTHPVENPSAIAGYTKNYNPTMAYLGDGHNRLTWIGERINGDDTGEPGNPGKIDATQGTIERRVILRARLFDEVFNSANTWNTSIFKFGTLVDASSTNHSSDNNYIIGWAEGTSQKYCTNSSFTTVHNVTGISGTGIQVGEAPTRAQMGVATINSLASPVQIQTVLEIDPVEKENSIVMGAGREGAIVKNNVYSYFTLADIFVDDIPVEFPIIDEFLSVDNIEGLNENLKTETFAVTDESQIFYSVSYGMLVPEGEDPLLSENESVSFKLQLVDNSTNEVLGEYDEVEFNEYSRETYTNASYALDCNGIGSRTVFVQLVVQDNMNPIYTLAQITTETEIISKNSIVESSFKGNLEVTEFGLSQNYPNPFNPSTVIEFALPKESNVKLEVFNVLGERVHELVNTRLKEGVHRVTFDASGLTVLTFTGLLPGNS